MYACFVRVGYIIVFCYGFIKIWTAIKTMFKYNGLYQGLVKSLTSGQSYLSLMDLLRISTLIMAWVTMGAVWCTLSGLLRYTPGARPEHPTLGSADTVQGQGLRESTRVKHLGKHVL